MSDQTEQSGASERGDLLKGLAAGLAGGLAASFVMNQFQAWWGARTRGVAKGHGAQSLQRDAGRADVPAAGPAEPRPGGTDATERLAAIVAKDVFDERLTPAERDAYGTAIHYAYGTTTGAVYGVAAEAAPAVTAAYGLPFGLGVWLLADQLAVPALKLSRPRAEYPPSVLAYSASSHLVYGLTAELVRRAVRSALD